ncbi:MAG: BrxA/BrxB family bacilliredoxin [Cyclobacteriaceae bacterium]|nr:BrxA/BrxB family bacilliredoxin [Cyclobacteriaceae bacterium]
MYPEQLVAPMRTDLTSAGFEEFRSAEEVVAHLDSHQGTTLVVINSVCGCAAGAARPGVKLSIENSEKRPDTLATVFAGVDHEAVSKMREYTAPYPPSSPSIALFKDGDLIHFVERHHIEGRTAEMIGNHLIEVYQELC